jgi:hypothetical protein
MPHRVIVLLLLRRLDIMGKARAQKIRGACKYNILKCGEEIRELAVFCNMIFPC